MFLNCFNTQKLKIFKKTLKKNYFNIYKKTFSKNTKQPSLTALRASTISSLFYETTILNATIPSRT
jgi:hypothetical protein